MEVDIPNKNRKCVDKNRENNSFLEIFGINYNIYHINMDDQKYLGLDIPISTYGEFSCGDMQGSTFCSPAYPHH